MCKKIKKFKMYIGGYVGYEQRLLIKEDKNGRYRVWYSEFGHDENDKNVRAEIYAKEDIINFFYNNLNEINICQWERHYLNPDISDGIYWAVCLKFEDDSEFVSAGRNAYPVNWVLYKKLFDRIVGKIKKLIEENRDSIDVVFGDDVKRSEPEGWY